MRGDSAVKYDELFHLRFNLLQATYQIQQIVITIYLQNIVRGRSKLKTFYILLFWEIIRPLIHMELLDGILFYKKESKNLFAPLKI